MLEKLASWLFFPVVLVVSLIAGNNLIEAGHDTSVVLLGSAGVIFAAERLFPKKTIVTKTADGVKRTTYGEWAERTRRLGGVAPRRGPYSTTLNRPWSKTLRTCSRSWPRRRITSPWPSTAQAPWRRARSGRFSMR